MAAVLDTLVLPAGAGLRCIDAASGQPVADGLRATLLRRRDGQVLARASTSASGVLHWPGLVARWAMPDPLAPPLADLLVQDAFDRFLPLALAWPLPAGLPSTLHGAARLAELTLLSAPQRPTPPGCASMVALLVWDGAPAAWARVRLTDLQGRVTLGSADAQGRLAVHLPLGRPQRDPVDGSLGAPVGLALFFDPGLAAAAAALGAPDAQAWAAQPEVRALARADGATALDVLRLTVGPAAVPVTEGLSPRRSELRLVAL